MKKIRYGFVFIAIMLALIAMGQTDFAASGKGDGQDHNLIQGQPVHGLFQNNANSCGFCHSIHNANDASNLFSGKINNKVSVNPTASNQFCEFCHDGTSGVVNNTIGYNPDFEVLFTDGKNSSTPTYNAHGSGYVNLLKNVKDSTGYTMVQTANPQVTPITFKEAALQSLHPKCLDCHSPHGSTNKFNLNTRFGIKTTDAQGNDTRAIYDTSAPYILRDNNQHIDTYYFCTQCHNGVTRIQANVDINGDTKIDTNDYITLYDVTNSAYPYPGAKITGSHQSATPNADGSTTRSCGARGDAGGCHTLNGTYTPTTGKATTITDYMHTPPHHKVPIHY